MQRLARLVTGVLSVTSIYRKETTTYNTPRTDIPMIFTGKWQMGTFPMKDFWSYTGSYNKNAGSYSLCYSIEQNGSAEEFYYTDIISNDVHYQVLGYRAGTMTFEEDNHTMRFYAASGNYRTYVDGAGRWSQYEDKDIYPIYAPTYENCTVASAYGKMSFLQCIDDNNDLLLFQQIH